MSPLITLRLSADDKTRFEKYAREARLSLSAWVRMAMEHYTRASTNAFGVPMSQIIEEQSEITLGMKDTGNPRLGEGATIIGFGSAKRAKREKAK